jgi:hypothetical protein
MTTALKPISTVFRLATTCPHCGGNLDEPQAQGFTLVTIRGDAQKIVEKQVIGCRYERSQWLNEVPVYCVEDRATPPKEPLTEP